MNWNDERKSDDRDIDPFEEPNYENIDEERAHESHRTLRAAIWIVSGLIVFVMVGLPVLNIVQDSRRNNREAAVRDAREHVAVQFTAAALDRRSTRGALQWVHPSLSDEVDELVSYLRTRGEATLDGAEASLARVECGPNPYQESECFQAWLRQPGDAATPDIIRIWMIVAIVDGQARVVAIQPLSPV
jgi:hypothetical protein